MKRFALVVAGVLVVGLAGAMTLLWLMFRTPYPPQPEFGFTGDWRSFSTFGTDERPLPPAREVAQDYATWQPKTEYRNRVYLARLGGTNHQSNFRSSVVTGDTPMGAQKYTFVEFTYNDPTNGIYHLSWSLRGEHEVDFLRFDTNYRLYQLRPSGDAGNQTPELSIRALEGIKPEHYDRR